MSRQNVPRQTGEDEESEYAALGEMATSTKKPNYAKYAPFAAVFSFVGVLLYVAVGGVAMTDVPYMAIAYAVGVAGLTVAYLNVAKWVMTARAIQMKPVKYEGVEHVWFTLFYNNAFYVFMLFLGSHIIFSGLQPKIAMIMTQVCAVAIPAWMSSLSK